MKLIETLADSKKLTETERGRKETRRRKQRNKATKRERL